MDKDLAKELETFERLLSGTPGAYEITWGVRTPRVEDVVEVDSPAKAAARAAGSNLFSSGRGTTNRLPARGPPGLQDAS